MRRACFCCHETAALFKQAVREPLLVYNGEAWQRLAEVCVRSTLNTTDTFGYETHKSRTGTTNNHAQKNKHIMMVDTAGRHVYSQFSCE